MKVAMVEAVWNQDMDGCLLVRKGESFIEYEAKVSSRVSSVKWGVMDFGKLFAETNEQNSVLEELSIRRFAVCLSICPSQDGVLPTWLNTESRKQCCIIAQVIN